MIKRRIGGGMMTLAALVAAWLLPETFPEVSPIILATGWAVAAIALLIGIWLLFDPRKRRKAPAIARSGPPQLEPVKDTPPEPAPNIQRILARADLVRRIIDALRDALGSEERMAREWLDLPAARHIWGTGMDSSFRAYAHGYDRWRDGMRHIQVQLWELMGHQKLILPVNALADDYLLHSAPHEKNIFGLEENKIDQDRILYARKCYADHRLTKRAIEQALGEHQRELQGLEQQIALAAG